LIVSNVKLAVFGNPTRRWIYLCQEVFALCHEKWIHTNQKRGISWY